MFHLSSKIEYTQMFNGKENFIYLHNDSSLFRIILATGIILERIFRLNLQIVRRQLKTWARFLEYKFNLPTTLYFTSDNNFTYGFFNNKTLEIKMKLLIDTLYLIIFFEKIVILWFDVPVTPPRRHHTPEDDFRKVILSIVPEL